LGFCLFHFLKIRPRSAVMAFKAIKSVAGEGMLGDALYPRLRVKKT
jgi:hypothetical protein